MNAKLKTTLYLSAIFLAGALTGGVLGACIVKRTMFLHPPRPHEIAEHIKYQLHSQLNLSPEQQQKIDPLLDQTDATLKAIHSEAMGKVAKAIDETHNKIAAELNPEQKAKLLEIEKNRRQFLRQRFPHGMQGRPDSSQGGPWEGNRFAPNYRK